MKVILQDNRRYVLRFDKDEEVFSGLLSFAQENKLTAAEFSGIGTCSNLEMGFYNTFLKEYRKKPFFDNYEIVSLTGSIAISDNKPVIHAHGIFSNNEFSTIGGHLFKLVVAATCEVFLIKLDGNLERKINPDYNLNLLV